MKRKHIWFWSVWSIVMAIQAIRSIVSAVREPRIGFQIMWIMVCLIYAAFSYGSVQIVRAALRQRGKTDGRTN
ncbi:MAG: hypothetical protein WA609_06350 [Terriglobales bacterium]|jgi:hypothetical protein